MLVTIHLNTASAIQVELEDEEAAQLAQALQDGVWVEVEWPQKGRGQVVRVNPANVSHIQLVS